MVRRVVARWPEHSAGRAAVRETVTQDTRNTPSSSNNHRAKASGWSAGLMTRNTSSRLILTLHDGVLRVYESVEDAVRDVEALDVEGTFRAVFDDTGEVYAIRWIRPNARGRFFRFIVGNGEYTLVPEDRKDIPALLRLLREARLVEPRGAERRLQEVERRLTS